MADYKAKTITPELLDPPAIVLRDDRRAIEAVEQVVAIDQSIVANQFELGELLAEIKDNDYFAAHKVLSFDELLKKLSLDISASQVRYLVNNHKMATRLGISREQLKKAKISKVKTIFQLDPDKELVDDATGEVTKMADVMVTLVNESPFKKLSEIEAIVKRLKDDTTPEGERRTWRNFSLTEDGALVVDEAIELIIANAGSTIDIQTGTSKDVAEGTALVYMAANCIADPNLHAEDLGVAGNFEDSVFVDEDGTEYSEAD
jgi:hypothetical protein